MGAENETESIQRVLEVYGSETLRGYEGGTVRAVVYASDMQEGYQKHSKGQKEKGNTQKGVSRER